MINFVFVFFVSDSFMTSLKSVATTVLVYRRLFCVSILFWHFILKRLIYLVTWNQDSHSQRRKSRMCFSYCGEKLQYPWFILFFFFPVSGSVWFTHDNFEVCLLTIVFTFLSITASAIARRAHWARFRSCLLV